MATQPSKISRPRQPRSCINCARRKIKCDKAKPQCHKCLHASLKCSYVQSRSLEIIDLTPHLDAEHSNQMATHLRRVSELANEALEPQVEEQVEGNNPRAAFAGHLHKGPQTKSSYVSPTHFAMIGEEISKINDILLDQHQYSVDLVLDEGQAEEDEYASSNGSSFLHPITHSPRRESGKPERLLYGDLFPHVPRWNPKARESQPQETCVNELVANLPSKSQLDLLLWSYMVGYHPMAPLFHGPSFVEEVQKLHDWTSGSDSTSHPSLHLVSLMCAVIFAGAVICPRHQLERAFGQESREDLSSRLYKQAVRAIRETGFPQAPSLQSMAAFIIVDTTWLREEQPLTCCAFVGVALRVAQMLGLHKEPSNFKNVTTLEVNVRRQIWWVLVAVDSQVAFASGLPPLVNCKHSDVQEPNEAPVTLPVNGLSVNTNYTKSVLGILFGGKVQFVKRACDFLHILHNSFLGKEDLDRALKIVDEIAAEMEVRSNQITELEQTILKNVPDQGQDTDMLRQAEFNPTLARFAKTILPMLAAKPYAIMHGPVRRHGLREHLNQVRPEAIKHCREYLHRFLKLTQCRDFQPWHWCWPGQHQPLHSVMALVVDLDEYPSQIYAEETRQLVNLAIYMSGGSEDTGIVSKENGEPDPRPLDEGGAGAWNFIRRARAKVWQKAGLDPSVLTCPRNAADIHFGDDQDSQPGTESIPTEGFIQDEVWGPFPETRDNFISLGDVVEPHFGFITSPGYFNPG